MTHDSEKIVSPAGLMPDELDAIGYMPGVEAKGVLGHADDLEITAHPIAMLRDDEMCGEMVDRWGAYGPDAIPAAWYEDGWSSWECEAWQTMRAAHAREERRRLKDLGNGD